MNNSADIRRENKRAIYRFMLDGQAHTKQQVSAGTGLSAATCNTLLNDMTAQGLFLAGNKQAGEVGRSSVLYRINESYESYLAVHFYVVQQERWMEYLVFSPSGKILSKQTQKYALLDYPQVEALIGRVFEMYPNLTRIIIGTPSIAQLGIIRHCDIPELENVPMKQWLEEKFSLPVAMENDMHHKAYGYYIKTGNRDDVISLGYFSDHILPGTATIHKGTIIRGVNSFAGMTGFLPYDVSREEQLAMLVPETCMPFIAKSLCAIIVLLNPGTIVLTGNLIREDMLEALTQKIREDIPVEYMPEFKIADSFDEYYYEGMYRLAVDKKEF